MGLATYYLCKVMWPYHVNNVVLFTNLYKLLSLCNNNILVTYVSLLTKFHVDIIFELLDLKEEMNK